MADNGPHSHTSASDMVTMEMSLVDNERQQTSDMVTTIENNVTQHKLDSSANNVMSVNNTSKFDST